MIFVVNTKNVFDFALWFFHVNKCHGFFVILWLLLKILAVAIVIYEIVYNFY